MVNPWTYNGHLFRESEINDNVGFVYLITNLKTGRMYVGKKLFFFHVKRKRANKVNRKIIKKESDWKEYYGSCKELHKDINNLGETNFKREILKLCKDKFDLAYTELEEQVNRRVLFTDGYYNEYIGTRLKKKRI